MKKICLLLATVLTVVGLYRISPYHQTEREPLQLIQPQVMDIRDLTTLQGTIIDPSPKKIYPKGAGVVLEVLVKPGETVYAGQALMRLESTDRTQGMEASAEVVLSEVRQVLEQGDLVAAEALLEGLTLPDMPNDSGKSVCKDYQLYSPVDGIVMDISVAAGEPVSGMLPCMEICDPQNLLIEATAEEDVVGQLQENMRCEIRVPAFELTQLSGEIATIMPYAKQASLLSGNATAKTTLHISVTDPARLRPGYRATVRVITANKSDAILVPYEAVSQDETGQEYVKIIEDNKVVKRSILTDSELETSVQIIQGIAPQDILLLCPEDAQEGEVVKYAHTGTADAGN